MLPGMLKARPEQRGVLTYINAKFNDAMMVAGPLRPANASPTRTAKFPRWGR